MEGCVTNRCTGRVPAGHTRELYPLEVVPSQTLSTL